MIDQILAKNCSTKTKVKNRLGCFCIEKQLNIKKVFVECDHDDVDANIW